ncbi:hypothetical protein [Paucibacter sp. Y2R2-4]|uniref:hypothetical protein n=1 Tax=Paucibacter sp. Y2R2-4 TaxID=2893553 RepID=UPI0021E3CA5A|nr:hypothetical protein [Paucibacter sp. Y2R2-4]MCV2351219.1 hypothetical protein [Paucibacter sp. Y2R2-4]
MKAQDEILLVNVPPSFEPELLTLQGVRVLRDPKQAKSLRFALAFTTQQAELDALSQLLTGKAEGDALIWFAYPKGSSKCFKCDFNRDTGWDSMRSAGFDTVRQISIDEDWTALRFRRLEFIRSSSPAKTRVVGE